MKTDVAQRPILSLLLFLIYINNQSVAIISTVKLFSDDTLFFSIVDNSKSSAYQINQDLKKCKLTYI